MREISTMSVFFVDEMRSLDWYRETLFLDEETPFKMICDLAHSFARKNPRLGSYEDVEEHIIRGIGRHKVFTNPTKFFNEVAPSSEEYKQGIRTSIKFFVSAFDGCGCIEWKSGVECTNIDASEIL